MGSTASAKTNGNTDKKRTYTRIFEEKRFIIRTFSRKKKMVFLM